MAGPREPCPRARARRTLAATFSSRTANAPLCRRCRRRRPRSPSGTPCSPAWDTTRCPTTCQDRSVGGAGCEGGRPHGRPRNAAGALPRSPLTLASSLQVQSMATIAGLEFLSATATLEPAAEPGQFVRAYDLTGQSYGVHFRASFRANDETQHIQELHLAVSPEARSELAQFVATYARGGRLRAGRMDWGRRMPLRRGVGRWRRVGERPGRSAKRRCSCSSRVLSGTHGYAPTGSGCSSAFRATSPAWSPFRIRPPFPRAPSLSATRTLAIRRACTSDESHSTNRALGGRPSSAAHDRRHDEAHGPPLQLVLLYELRLTADGRVEPSLALLPRVAKPGLSRRRSRDRTPRTGPTQTSGGRGAATDAGAAFGSARPGPVQPARPTAEPVSSARVRGGRSQRH